jgi:CubicO group peptidase (beta-lactamase class C family)
MTNSERKRRVLWGGFLVFALLNLIIMLSGNTYLYKAVWYNFAGIHDLGIFPSRTISPAEAIPWPVSKKYNQTPLPEELLQKLEELETVAFLVIKDDSLINEYYWKGHTDSTVSNSFSMAKTFVGILTGCAIDDGYISSLDQPLSDYLPSWKGTGVTLRHAITMSSGITWDESYANPFSITTKAYYGNDLSSLTDNIRPSEKAGEKFKYLSGNTLLLAAVLNKATGKSLSEYFEERIWKRIGAERPAYWSLDRKNGIEKAYCCLYSTARDFARIGKLFMNEGEFNGKRIISGQFVRESVIPAPITDDQGKRISHYGYSWWIIPFFKGKYVYYARGILGQYIIVIPEKRTIIVRLGWKRGKKAGFHYPEVFDYTGAILEMYPG